GALPARLAARLAHSCRQARSVDRKLAGSALIWWIERRAFQASNWVDPPLRDSALFLEQPRLVQIKRENRQLDIGRAGVLLVEEQHSDIFVAHVDFRRVLLPEPRNHADALTVEFALEVGVELLDIRTGGGRIAQGDLHLEIVGALVVILVLIENERADTLL